MSAAKDPLVEPFRDFTSRPAQQQLLQVLYRKATGDPNGRLGQLRLTDLVEAAARDAAHRDPDHVLDQQRTHREYYALFEKLAKAGWGAAFIGRRGQPTRFEFRQKYVAADLARVFAMLGIQLGAAEETVELRTAVERTSAPQGNPNQALRREDVLALLRAHADELRRLGVAKLSLFGSLARDEARADSDVDLLVAFDGPVTSEKFFGAKFMLEDLLGKRIDLVTDAALRERVRREIEPEIIRVA